MDIRMVGIWVLSNGNGSIIMLMLLLADIILKWMWPTKSKMPEAATFCYCHCVQTYSLRASFYLSFFKSIFFFLLQSMRSMEKASKEFRTRTTTIGWLPQLMLFIILLFAVVVVVILFFFFAHRLSIALLTNSLGEAASLSVAFSCFLFFELYAGMCELWMIFTLCVCISYEGEEEKEKRDETGKRLR